MKKMRISNKILGGIWCPDLKGHYRLSKAVAQRKDKKGRVTVPYSFYSGQKWFDDVAFITPGRLDLLISFADKSRLEVHRTYRDLAAGGASEARQVGIGPVPEAMDFRA